MRNYTFDVKNINDLELNLKKLSLDKEVVESNSMLFHLFTFSLDIDFIKRTNKLVASYFPAAKLVGSSTSGEITDGEINEQTIAVSLICFDDSEVKVLSFDCTGNKEVESGKSLYKYILLLDDVKGVEILSNVKGIDNRSFLNQLNELPDTYQIFGGGADAYDNGNYTIVFEGSECFVHGAVAVIYCGKTLKIKSNFSLGWKPLGKAMCVTEVKNNDMTLVKVDDHPAVEIYEKYLNIENKDDFHTLVEEFPIIVERDGHNVSRVPITSHSDGTIDLGADVKKGELIRLGYGDPAAIMNATLRVAERMAVFRPQAILLFCCITRKVFLREYAVSDALPFKDIAPSCGFYTYGEISRFSKHNFTLNSSHICVGMREGEPKDKGKIELELLDNQLKGHISLVQRLVRFVEATTADLEEANQKLNRLATYDRLTNILNRGEIEQRLQTELERVKRGKEKMSVIMIDIDDFKNVNDTYGHSVGDKTLISVAKILKQDIRIYDSVGRWGGEEFFIILFGAGEKDALKTAERILHDIEDFDFFAAGHLTVSIGVSEAIPCEPSIALYKRVDDALYQAKATGKDKIVIK